MSEASKEKMRAAWARRAAAGIPSPRLGRKHSAATRALISERTAAATPRGPRHYAWKGGVTKAQRDGRKIPGYKTWRRCVARAAGGYCEACQRRAPAGLMHAHHIVGYAARPDLALAVNNGVWICEDCHRECHAA